jgi:ubiquinone/menaquinone biosynthesis C-methylase UbiE
MLAGIDLDWEGLRANPFVSARILGTLERLPFRAESFDVATANMVVEHLGSPAAMLEEVNRVLRPGGLFILHTPNRNAVMIRVAAAMPQSMKNFLARLLEGRREEDVFPAFYRMNTLAAISQMAAASGFRVQQIRSLSSSAVTALLGPVAIMELLYLRLLEAKRFRNYRSNLIAVLQKAA